MDGNVGGTGQTQGPNMGGSGSLSDFATQVAQKKQQITELEQQLTGPNAQNLTPTQLSDYAKQVATLKQQLETLQQNCPPEDTADQEEIANLQGQIQVLSSVLAAAESGRSIIMSDVSITQELSAALQNSNDPKLDPGKSGVTVSNSDQGNLFLASSFMAILWKVESTMIHQSLENMDQERMCKIMGYQNIMEFGNMQAQAAYKSDMDQANMYLVQFYQAVAQGAVTLFTAMGGLGRQGKIEKENEQLKDNEAYNQRLTELRNAHVGNIKGKDRDIMTKNGVFDPNYYTKPLPKVLDKNGKELTPGRKQIQEEQEYADNTYKYDSSTTAAGTTTLTAAGGKQKTEDQKRLKQAYDDNKVAIESSHYRLSNDQMLNMWKQTLPQMGQSIIQAYAALENYKFSVDKATQDYNKLLYDTAMQVAHSYLDNSSQCFQGELQNIQQIVEFLMQAAQKNTQWASIRA